MKRRSFLKMATGVVAGMRGLDFLTRLPRVGAAEVQLDTRMVRLHPEIEPLVRLLEETPRERILEEVAGRLRAGLTYRELLAALLLAGVRNIQPRPVGFKFHAVLVVNSAHLASLASPDRDRWLPIFWAIDRFKASQEADVREGDWALGPVQESAIPPAHKARQALLDAMDSWDEAAADAAITGLARTGSAHELFEIFCRYGVRDFREIGHKAIYVANSFRTLEVIGWQHAEPVLRSLTYALLDRDGEERNPAKADLPADRPFRRNLENSQRIRADWLGGQKRSGAAADFLETVRTGSAVDTSEKIVQLLNQGVAPQSLFEGILNAAGELLMQRPGILSLHAVTFSNAVHYAWKHARTDETRRLLLLQNAAFLPLFRGQVKDKGLRIDALESAPLKTSGEAALEEIFSEIGTDRLSAARKILTLLRTNPDPTPLAAGIRRLIFLKGRDSHDYKFSSAVLEDYLHLESPWRDRFLAASVFNYPGSAAPDNSLVARTRAALGG